MSGSLTWRGDAIKKRVQEAQRLAIDETTASCVEPAKNAVRIKTHILQGSIKFRPAQRDGSRTIGRWGSFDKNYALWQEILTFAHAGHQPYLRPAAAEEYPKLAERVKAYFQR
jgi:hypothetical protein